MQQAQRACRGQAGYVPVTERLLLDQGHAATAVAPTLGVDVSSVYRYAQTYQLRDPTGYLPIADWLARTHGIRYSVSDLTDPRYQLGFSYKLTTALPNERNGSDGIPHRHVGPVTGPSRRRGSGGLFRRCGPRHPRVDQNEKKRPRLTVSDRERVNLNAALNAHCPTQVHLNETDCVNAQSTQRRYGKLLAAHPEGPVHIICDNAHYDQNKVLTAWLTK